MLLVPFVSTSLAVAAGFVLGASPLRLGGQAGAPVPPGRQLIGAWRLTFDTPAGPSQSLLTVMAEGTLVFSGRPVSPAAGGFPVVFSSTAHGAWQPAGDGKGAFTWVGLVTDGEGTLLAVVTDSVEASLAADSDSWSGSYSATVQDPEGNVLYVGGSTVKATRITVQPLATAGATPASS